MATTATPTATAPAYKPAKLIRGLSNIPHEDEKLAGLVLTVLKEDSAWQGVPQDKIVVKDVSGWGGCRTFKVSAPVQERDDAVTEFPLGAISPRCTLEVPTVVLHSRLEDHAEHYMQRSASAAAVITAHSLAPKRLAEGGDWFLGQWEGFGSPKFKSEEDHMRYGAFVARVHQVDISWFEPHREEMIQRIPKLQGVDHGSHAWVFATRGHHAENMCQGFTTGPFAEEGAFEAWANLGPVHPTHPLLKRLVTTHGDIHPGNLLDLGHGSLSCVDFEFTCVTSAAFDLACGIACSGNGSRSHKKAFLKGYAQEMGEPDANLDALLLDVELTKFTHWHSGGKLHVWGVESMSTAGMLNKIEACRLFSEEARSSPSLQEEIFEHGLSHVSREHKLFTGLITKELACSETYAKLQKELDEAAEEAAILAPQPPLDGGMVATIHPAENLSTALQVRPGTNMLELGGVEAGSENQQWRLVEDRIQHVASGWMVDAEVEYLFLKRNAPWETAASSLCVKPQDDSERQRWLIDGQMIQHRLDGRVLDVNAWQLEAGRGVNLNAPHTTCHGCSWRITPIEGEQQGCASSASSSSSSAAALGTLEECVVMTREEVAEGNMTWSKLRDMATDRGARLPTVYELKASQVHTQREFGDCWVPVALTGKEAHDPCVRFTGRVDGKVKAAPEENAWVCLSTARPYVVEFPKWGLDAAHAPKEALLVIRLFWDAFNQLGNLKREGEVEEVVVVPDVYDTQAPEIPIADFDESTQFYICPAKAQEFCLAPGKDEEDPSKVKLATITGGDARQKWTLVAGDRFQNCHSGEFLDSDVQYIHMDNINEIWCSNGTPLRTAPRCDGPSQRWVYGPEEFHGGKVLRHYMDGRGVDVHGWRFKDGGNVGVENSIHSTCDGISYVLRLCQEVEVGEEKT